MIWKCAKKFTTLNKSIDQRRDKHECEEDTKYDELKWPYVHLNWKWTEVSPKVDTQNQINPGFVLTICLSMHWTFVMRFVSVVFTVRFCQFTGMVLALDWQLWWNFPWYNSNNEPIVNTIIVECILGEVAWYFELNENFVTWMV